MLYILPGPKPKEIKVETFRIDYLKRSPKVEKLGFEPVSIYIYIYRLLHFQIQESQNVRVRLAS